MSKDFRPWQKRPPLLLLLPKSVRHPLSVFGVCVLPQLLLLFVNFQAWDLASGEMNENEILAARQIFVLQLLALASGVAMTAWLAVRKETFTRWQGFVPLIPALCFLAGVMVLADAAIPAAVESWMLPRDQWMLKQFALVMPAALFGGLRIICPDREENDAVGRAFSESIGFCVLLFGCSIGYIFLSVFTMAAAVGRPDNFPVFQIALLAGYMALATLAAASLFRLCIGAYVRARAYSPHPLSFYSFCVALAGPLLGLALNLMIPFPSDFQMWEIYALAVLNGAVLMLPNFSHPLAHRLTWLAQCALFPFTLYFFCVFVPFVLLAPLGLIWMGMGALIYVPSLLFLLHGYRIIDGYRAEIRDGGKWVPAALAVAAILAWPVGYTIRAQMDRASLNGALDYLQYPNYSRNSTYPGSVPALKSSLEHLRDFKEGLYLPFVSDYYNWIVFKGMVLPQKRMTELSETFLGQELAKSSRRESMMGANPASMRGRQRTVAEVMGGEQGMRPTTNARIGKLDVSTRAEQGLSRTSARIEVVNPTSSTTEFATTISVPPGVLISGLWLTIGTERVPGKLFEKRAAMWVYQKITEVRPVPRDPAILRFTGPETAELRVYPVEAGKPRFVEVEFLYPSDLNPAVEIQGHGRLAIGQTPSPAAFVAKADNGAFAVTVPASTEIPSLSRKPYLHFVVDASKNSKFADPAKLRESVEAAAKQFPGVSDARMTFANFETKDFRGGALVPLGELLSAPDADLRDAGRGGFLEARAIKEVLWRQARALDAGEKSALERFPQIVVLRGTDKTPLPDETGNLAEFARLLPDLPGYWTLNPSSEARFASFAGEDELPVRVPVHILQAGGARFATAAGKPAFFVSSKAAAGPVDRVEVYDPVSGRYVLLSGEIRKPADSAYTGSIQAWGLEIARFFEPWRRGAAALGELLAACRETGVLVPSVAYMVVENTAQWKMLERTEKKTLKGGESLQLQEASTPEPNAALLILASVVLLLGMRWRVRPSGAW